MCMIERADGLCEFESSRMAKARIPHRCSECKRTIQAGEQYERSVHKYDGDFGTTLTCIHCIEARKWLLRECSGYCWGGVEEDLFERWHEDGIRTRELASLIFGMKRTWTKRRGGLMPLPHVALPIAR